uniref:Uncharacterized protein n=1 Tax=Nelumbo nucifera TaxID=4432 RepID=A0A822Y874_NELNU|nr:TPA_asm: hypothetical protein HUJ06_028977 [Nelumbo nucifera]
MEAFAKNCKGLKKLSCGSCVFGSKGMNAILDHCFALKELSFCQRHCGISSGGEDQAVERDGNEGPRHSSLLPILFAQVLQIISNLPPILPRRCQCWRGSM